MQGENYNLIKDSEIPRSEQTKQNNLFKADDSNTWIPQSISFHYPFPCIQGALITEKLQVKINHTYKDYIHV
jgi:hypothetical protein